MKFCYGVYSDIIIQKVLKQLIYLYALFIPYKPIKIKTWTSDDSNVTTSILLKQLG